MTESTQAHRLQVATPLYRFIEDQVLPGTGVDSDTFWRGFDAIVHELSPKNAALLAERDRLQAELDAWHQANPGPIRARAKYRRFLEKIGYLVPLPERVRATAKNVDAELALQAGPQLVVPTTRRAAPRSSPTRAMCSTAARRCSAARTSTPPPTACSTTTWP